MKLVERLYQYLAKKDITAYAFEHSCGVSNGYLGKQLKGKGSIGSDILQRIKENYTDLSLLWLVTGKGTMLIDPLVKKADQFAYELNEEQEAYFTSKDEIISLLKQQIAQLETVIIDKNKIIALLERKTR
ncbi:MAG: hypothetical protein NVSMB63_15490 [Sediminibacterium sp.]